MKVIDDIARMQKFCRNLRNKGISIGFVPTMGALHLGHLSLIRAAKKENKCVVVSVFVNPLQFAAGEDYLKYPRALKNDLKLCRREGVDVVFNPEPDKLYPSGYKTHIKVNDLGEVLCGWFRKGHFQGVATVVNKLFNIVLPDKAYFGQKDAQQAVIITAMVKDLNMPVKIRVMPIIRQSDGLALSSRNVYLSPKQRRDALVLNKALKLAKLLVSQGEKDYRRIIAKMRFLIGSKDNVRIQYISIVDTDSLLPVERIKKKALIALSVYIGKTRLIDNIIVKAHN